MSDEFLNDKGEPVFDYDYYMGKLDQRALSVLKGHLLAEWALDRLAKLKFSESKYQQYEKKSFKRRACKLKKSLQDRSTDERWGLVFTLNEIRNEYAHELEPDVGEKFAELYRLDEKIHPNSLDAGDAERLDRAMQHCLEFLLSLDKTQMISAVS